MTGLSRDLFGRLRSAMLECVRLDNNEAIVAVFADPRLHPWRHQVPRAGDSGTLADMLIARLVDRRRSDTGENALVLLFRVLGEKYDEADACHTQLMSIARELELAIAHSGQSGERRTMNTTILVLAANPMNTSQLHLDKEVREIVNGLERAQKRDEIIVIQKWAARPKDVRRAMLDYRPNIVHFSGHGSGVEGIVFEDDTGQAKFVDADTLAEFFQLFADNVECVLLNACYSEVQADAVARHIPYVIGMNEAIGDIAAIEFSVAFYDAVGAGESIEFAFSLACNAIRWTGLPEYLTPKLKTMRRSPRRVSDR